LSLPRAEKGSHKIKVPDKQKSGGRPTFFRETTLIKAIIQENKRRVKAENALMGRASEKLTTEKTRISETNTKRRIVSTFHPTHSNLEFLSAITPI